MREVVDAGRLRDFMRALGEESKAPARVYFTGGTTAVLVGWRASTIDADILIEPESEALFRALPEIKERLRMNVELASPADFIPELPGWRDRSRWIAREGRLDFHDYDFYAQALAKIERGHVQDRGDVAEMLARGLVAPDRLRAYFDEIEGRLYRYPAIDPPSFRAALEETLRAG